MNRGVEGGGEGRGGGREGEYTVGFHRCQFSIADETENEWLQSLRDRYNVPGTKVLRD